MPRTTKRQALKAAAITGPVDIHFYPRTYQLRAWDALTEGRKKRALLIWPRGVGKDLLSLWVLWYWMVQWPGQYFHVFTSYGQGKRGIWEASYQIQGRTVKYLDIFPPQLIEDISETELQIRLKPIPPNTVGSIYQIIGAENADAIRGTHPNGVVLSEYRDMRKRVWEEVVEPALAARDGFAIFASTPRGKNHLYDLYEAAKGDPYWFVERLDHTIPKEDGVGEPGGVIYTEPKMAQLRIGKDPATVAQEYDCSFEENAEGAVYGRELRAAELDGRISDFPILSNAPVGTCWDLGYGDASAVWLYQTDGRWVDFIDYIEETHHTSAEMAALVKQRLYSYVRHVMPWDVDQQHDKVTRRDTLEALGIRPILAMSKTDLREQHDTTRLNFPRFRIHKTKCARGLASLGGYSYEWDEEKQIFKDKPRHDWASHGASALAQGALQGFTALQEIGRPTHTHAEMTFDLWHHDRPRERERDAEMTFSLFGR